MTAVWEYARCRLTAPSERPVPGISAEPAPPPGTRYWLSRGLIGFWRGTIRGGPCADTQLPDLLRVDWEIRPAGGVLGDWSLPSPPRWFAIGMGLQRPDSTPDITLGDSTFMRTVFQRLYGTCVKMSGIRPGIDHQLRWCLYLLLPGPASAVGVDDTE